MPLPVPTYTTSELSHFPADGNRYELLEGQLLVTPAPGSVHQVVLSRLQFALSSYLLPGGVAQVVSPGEIEIAPRTLLNPDLLVFPARFSPGTPWPEITEWWLAVEVFSRSSRVYDRDFKRDAYLRLGVAEVWLVDPRDRCLLISSTDGPRDVRRAGRWSWAPPGMPAPLQLDVEELLMDVSGQD